MSDWWESDSYYMSRFNEQWGDEEPQEEPGYYDKGNPDA